MNLKLYFNFLRLLLDEQNRLGLNHLTESDRRVLLVLWEMSNNGKDEFRVTYKKCLALLGEQFISKAQFYQTIKKAIEIEMLIRKDSSRTGRYKFQISN